jgi:hypothetical protein
MRVPISLERFSICLKMNYDTVKVENLADTYFGGFRIFDHLAGF